MSEPAKFEVRIPDVDPAQLVEFQGENGPFYLTRIGGKPELEKGFFYGDSKHQFCFYIRVDWKPTAKGHYDVEVYQVTPRRLEGVFVRKLPRADATYIEKNIKKVFETRDSFFIERPLNDCDHPDEVRFTWRISQ